ncbi:MAG: hypothetical protein ACXQTV_03590 [Candidatus Hecatellaceae archaeon]
MRFQPSSLHLEPQLPHSTMGRLRRKPSFSLPGLKVSTPWQMGQIQRKRHTLAGSSLPVEIVLHH